jgi:hypothetical protein
MSECGLANEPNSRKCSIVSSGKYPSDMWFRAKVLPEPFVGKARQHAPVSSLWLWARGEAEQKSSMYSGNERLRRVKTVLLSILIGSNVRVSAQQHAGPAGVLVQVNRVAITPSLRTRQRNDIGRVIN